MTGTKFIFATKKNSLLFCNEKYKLSGEANPDSFLRK